MHYQGCPELHCGLGPSHSAEECALCTYERRVELEKFEDLVLFIFRVSTFLTITGKHYVYKRTVIVGMYSGKVLYIFKEML